MDGLNLRDINGLNMIYITSLVLIGLGISLIFYGIKDKLIPEISVGICLIAATIWLAIVWH